MDLRKSLEQGAVRSLRVNRPVTVGPTETARHAIRRMQEERSGCVIVVEHGRPIGILTERDVLMKGLFDGPPAEARAAEVMTASPTVVADSCSLAEVIRKMHRGGFRHIPVVDGAGCLTGVLSVKRIVEYLVEYFPASVFNLPPEPGQKQLAREGA